MTSQPVLPRPDRHRGLAEGGGVLMLGIAVAIAAALSMIMRAIA